LLYVRLVQFADEPSPAGLVAGGRGFGNNRAPFVLVIRGNAVPAIVLVPVVAGREGQRRD